jgi:hypothetical protein
MAFTDTLTQLPYTPRTQTASGFLPPMLRGMGHILFLLGCLSDDKVDVTTEEGQQELAHAMEHWNARATPAAVSTAARDRATLLGVALTEAHAEFADWDNDTRITRVTDLSHRILQYSADLDRELVGIRDSDPGTAL